MWRTYKYSWYYKQKVQQWTRKNMEWGWVLILLIHYLLPGYTADSGDGPDGVPAISLEYPWPYVDEVATEVIQGLPDESMRLRA